MGNFKTDTILKAIKGSGGVMSTIAKRLKVDWHTAKKYVNQNKDTVQAYENEDEAILDMADAGLYKAVKQGDLAAIKWLQSTRGKKRGYIQTQEVDATVQHTVLKVGYGNKTEED